MTYWNDSVGARDEKKVKDCKYRERATVRCQQIRDAGVIETI